MYDLQTADRLFKEMMAEDPRFAEKLVKEWRLLMPQEYSKTIYCKRFGKHIIDLEQYKTGLSFIKGQNGQKPQIWTTEEAEKILNSYIKDYENEDFYKYDAFLWLNVRRNDYPRINDPNEIAYIVYEDLHDFDLPFDPSERAFCWVEEHIDKEKEEFEQE